MTIVETMEQTHRIWKASFQTELNEGLESHLRQGALVGVGSALETALVQELTGQLGFEPYARFEEGGRKAPQQYRSGYFHRRVLTSFGHIPDLRVPKLRCGNAEREWRILVRYQCALQGVLDKLLFLYLLGLSLRDLQEAMYLLLGHMMSRSAINQVTLAAQTQMDRWRAQPILETPPVLIVDGVWMKINYPTEEFFIDRSGHRRRQVRAEERVILAAMAVYEDGRHYLLHYEIAQNEDTGTWTSFIQHLKERGLDPEKVQVVTSDGTKGLLEALQQELPKAKLQRCTVHKVRGFERHLKYQDLPKEGDARKDRRVEMKKEALDIFDAPTPMEAQERLKAFVVKWGPLEPEAVKNFKWGLGRCFTFYGLGASLHKLVRSSNLLERFFREFRSKADEIGVFPNEESALTIFHLVMVREHSKHNRVDFANTTRH